MQPAPTPHTVSVGGSSGSRVGFEPLSYAPVHPNEEERSLRDVEIYRAILGLTPPWTLANEEPHGRKKTTV